MRTNDCIQPGRSLPRPPPPHSTRARGVLAGTVCNTYKGSDVTGMESKAGSREAAARFVESGFTNRR
jgi:hypothetical protein